MLFSITRFKNAYFCFRGVCNSTRQRGVGSSVRMMRNRHHYKKQLAGLGRRHSYFHLWDVVTTLAVVMIYATHIRCSEAAGAEDHIGGTPTGNHYYSPQFLTYVDQVLLDLVRVHNAFWTEGQWYNMTLSTSTESDPHPFFSLFYDKPGAIQVITDPTGVYGNSSYYIYFAKSAISRTQ